MAMSREITAAPRLCTGEARLIPTDAIRDGVPYRRVMVDTIGARFHSDFNSLRIKTRRKRPIETSGEFSECENAGGAQ